MAGPMVHGRRDYNDPEKYYRITETFAGPGYRDGEAPSTEQALGLYDWDQAGTNPLDAARYNTETGAFAVKGLVVNTALDDNTRWNLYNQNVSALNTGLRFRVRIRHGATDGGAGTVDSTADFYWHMGLSDGTGGDARVAGAQELLGFRFDTAVDGNVYGVVKTGAGAGNESVVSLGAASNAAWHTYELRLGAAAVQFYRDGVQMGSAPLTNMPNAGAYASNMRLQNLANPAAALKEVRITFWDLIAPTGY